MAKRQEWKTLLYNTQLEEIDLDMAWQNAIKCKNRIVLNLNKNNKTWKDLNYHALMSLIELYL